MIDRTLRITYQVVARGWASAHVSAGATSVELTASYLSDPLGDLLTAAVALAEGRSEYSFDWAQEPGRYSWRFTTGPEGTVQISIRDFVSSEHGPVIFNSVQDSVAVVRAVLRAADSVMDESGEVGYEELWARPFPADLLRRLRTTYQSL